MKGRLVLSLILVLSVKFLAHQQSIHQYLVRTSYQLIVRQLGHDIPEMAEHIGFNETGTAQFIPGGLVVIGAHREDEEDIVFYYNTPNETSTHFWEPDDGDGSKFKNSGGATFENAYYKASLLMYGGYELRVPYAGSQIIEVYEAPTNLMQFYKDRRIFYKGYYNSIGQFINRNYWDIVSPEFRDKVVWEILGRICHLLGDMTVPAHVHNDEYKILNR